MPRSPVINRQPKLERKARQARSPSDRPRCLVFGTRKPAAMARPSIKWLDRQVESESHPYVLLDSNRRSAK